MQHDGDAAEAVEPVDALVPERAVHKLEEAAQHDREDREPALSAPGGFCLSSEPLCALCVPVMRLLAPLSALCVPLMRWSAPLSALSVRLNARYRCLREGVALEDDRAEAQAQPTDQEHEVPPEVRRLVPESVPAQMGPSRGADGAESR